MSISIRTKLFMLIILANGIMVALILSINTAVFNRGFSEYVTQLESRRLELLMTNLTRAYDVSGGWGFLDGDDRAWIDLIRRSMSGRDRQILDDSRGGMMNSRQPFFDHLQIKNEKGELIIGQKSRTVKPIWLPILSQDGGEQIGQLGFEPDRRIDAQYDRLFENRLKMQLLTLSLVTFVIAAGLAIPFSGWLVKPILRLNDALKKLTHGDFSVSVDESRRDELGQLAEEFNRLVRVLNKAQSDRQQWVSDIAHELRTPVAVIQADIEAAQDGVREPNDKWLGNMVAHVERLGRLINDLNQLSKSDAGALSYRLEALNLKEITEDVLDQFEPAFTQHGIETEYLCSNSMRAILGDDKRLTQLLSNLAQNTLRYTDATAESPGKLRVSLSALDHQIKLTWEDSLPGVSDNDLPKLFDRLYRPDDSRSRETGGSGLGLAIAKNIVMAHQGTIQASHSELGGVKLTLTFPTLNEVKV